MSSQPSSPPRVVVRGSGSIGQRHARVFRQEGADVWLWPVRDRDLTGVGGVDEATGAHLLDDASGPAALRDAFVVVATDTSRHVADALEALDAGAEKVLVEKPVAPSADAVAALDAHPRRSAVWVAAPLRAHEGFRHLRRLVGRLHRGGSAHVWCQSWLPDWRPERDYRESYSARADEGGVLRDLVHEIDHATVLFGRPLLLGAVVDSDGPLDVESDQAATLLWRTPGDFAVTVRLDYTSRPASRGVVVRSPDGTLEWDVTRATVRHTSADGEVTEQVFDHDLDRDLVMGAQARAAMNLRPSTSVDERVARGAPATLTEGIDAVRLCDEARAAGAHVIADLAHREGGS
ncbi:Gfo/Idh/MocA family oxidoreductase [Terrabacter sp. NPDC000476]|uniref:Gfo/Idh/MocA family protein n=1 Tax=Terrabacter sp. NPDC000476 TaxID=3154258 RepID=UPI00332B0905